MSTGMATRDEVQEAVDAVYSQGNTQLALLKCSSVYPAKPEGMNLITVHELTETFDVISGLSDHSFGSLSAVASVALGGRIIEKHLCISRDLPDNPDAGFSMEPAEFKQMVDNVRNVQTAIGTEPFTYTESEQHSRRSRRSLYISKDMIKGDVFTESNIKSVRPGFGLHTRYYEEILGKRISMDAKMGTALSWDMIEK